MEGHSPQPPGVSRSINAAGLARPKSGWQAGETRYYECPKLGVSAVRLTYNAPLASKDNVPGYGMEESQKK